jgi:hypothetical protein
MWQVWRVGRLGGADNRGVKTMNGHDLVADVLIAAGRQAEADNLAAARRTIQERAPYVPRKYARRTITPRQALAVWQADGFRCRYTGERLFLPGFLRALGLLLPEDVPYHKNGRFDLTHDVHWTHIASVEHHEPLASGGTEGNGNWITTSMARNQVRSRHSLEQLGWKLLPRSAMPDWDGGSACFLGLMQRYPHLREVKALRDFEKWLREDGI